MSFCWSQILSSKLLKTVFRRVPINLEIAQFEIANEIPQMEKRQFKKEKNPPIHHKKNVHANISRQLGLFEGGMFCKTAMEAAFLLHLQFRNSYGSLVHDVTGHGLTASHNLSNIEQVILKFWVHSGTSQKSLMRGHSHP